MPAARQARLFTRMETDEELLERLRKAGRIQYSHETADQYAERCGMQRRLVEDEARP